MYKPFVTVAIPASLDSVQPQPISALHNSIFESILLTSPRMGELEPWIDENFIRSVWFGMGENVNVKMIRDKFSGWVPP